MSGEASRVERRHAHTARVLDTSSLAELAEELRRTESDPEGVGIMTRKGRIYPVRLDEVSLRAAVLLKQEMLAVGGDASHARGVADLSVERSAVVLLATWGQYQRLIPKLRRQPFRLREVAEEVDEVLRNYTHRGPRTIRGAHRSLVVGDRPRVMGVVNVTPDSFSDGGQHLDPERAIAQVLRLVQEGADAIDIGGESTRPGATPVPPEEEWRRIDPVLAGLREHLDRLRAPISVDTRHAEVARRAIEAGADIINDVTGLDDPEMRRVIHEHRAAAILMHMRGTPATMQLDTTYSDLRAEVYRALVHATDRAISEGIPADRLIVDPGLGFGKSAEQSLELLVHVGELRSLGYPVVLGASRKSMLGPGSPESRSEAGLAAAVLAAWNGAELLRVHDVAATVRALSIVTRARARPHPESEETEAVARAEEIER
ncbi:MAG: dihydropteroate synthase [Thermoplasmata archaeon]